MIRPYQKCIFNTRIPGIFFNSSDPHKKNGRTIKGRSEKIAKVYNQRYYLTDSNNLAHTHCISKLAVRISTESKGKNTNRLASIYDTIFIDEVQDLIGWDYDLLDKIIRNSACTIVCVGDFRQTLYATSTSPKSPKSNTEKLAKLESMGFDVEHMNISRRCIQSICDFSDLVHASEGVYPSTITKADPPSSDFLGHLGVFAVRSTQVNTYLAKYRPTILRRTKSTQTELCRGFDSVNFGESKGLGFNRILIIPTDKHIRFLSGDTSVFDKDKTDKAKNTLYVAITRAKYSVAFLCDNAIALKEMQLWTPS